MSSMDTRGGVRRKFKVQSSIDTNGNSGGVQLAERAEKACKGALVVANTKLLPNDRFGLKRKTMSDKETTHFKIHDMAEADRPREKLISQGAKALTEAELLAILIGSGTQESSALDVARQLLSAHGNRLDTLSRASLKDLCKTKGIGTARGINIVAALELGRRRNAYEAEEDVQTIKTSEDAYKRFRPLMADETREVVMVALLSNNNTVLQIVPMSEGTLTNALFDIREITKRAIDSRANGIVVAHNHPSGTLSPSAADRAVTNKLRDALELFGIKLLDHIIVVANDYYSFADHGLI